MDNKYECLTHILEIKEDEDFIIKPGNNDLVSVEIYNRYAEQTPLNAKFAVLALYVRIVTEKSKTRIYVPELREKEE